MAINQLLTNNHTLHHMDGYGETGFTFNGSDIVELYEIATHTGASVVMHINDGTNYERVLIEIGHHNLDIGFDETRILISGVLMDLTFTTAINAGNLELTITNSDAVSTTSINYYVMRNEFIL